MNIKITALIFGLLTTSLVYPNQEPEPKENAHPLMHDVHALQRAAQTLAQDTVNVLSTLKPAASVSQDVINAHTQKVHTAYQTIQNALTQLIAYENNSVVQLTKTPLEHMGLLSHTTLEDLALSRIKARWQQHYGNLITLDLNYISDEAQDEQLSNKAASTYRPTHCLKVLHKATQDLLAAKMLALSLANINKSELATMATTQNSMEKF